MHFLQKNHQGPHQNMADVHAHRKHQVFTQNMTNDMMGSLSQELNQLASFQ